MRIELPSTMLFPVGNWDLWKTTKSPYYYYILSSYSIYQPNIANVNDYQHEHHDHQHEHHDQHHDHQHDHQHDHYEHVTSFRHDMTGLGFPSALKKVKFNQHLRKYLANSKTISSTRVFMTCRPQCKKDTRNNEGNNEGNNKKEQWRKNEGNLHPRVMVDPALTSNFPSWKAKVAKKITKIMTNSNKVYFFRDVLQVSYFWVRLHTWGNEDCQEVFLKISASKNIKWAKSPKKIVNKFVHC